LFFLAFCQLFSSDDAGFMRSDNLDVKL